MVDDSPAVSIRPATCDDAYAIGEVHLSSWQTTYRGIGIDDFLDSVTIENRAARWSRVLCDSANPSFCYVAEVDRKVVGFAAGGAERTGDAEYKGEVYTLYLLQAYQRRGIGRKLVQTIAGHLVDIGYSSMLIWVLTVNPAWPFYEACGGKAVRQQQTDFCGKTFNEIGYGWLDLSVLSGQQG